MLSTALFAVCLASASNALTSYRSLGGGPLALAKIYYKYGVPLPDDLAAAVSRLQHTKRATGSALVTPEDQDLLYLVSVDIGTPPQRLNVDIDTGSGDFWVFSSLTLKSQVDDQAVYNPSNSTTASKLGDSTWEITYGDGSTSGGVVYVDHVTIGGLGVLSQAVEVAMHVSEGFTADSNNDGILGLAPANNHVRPTKQKTFFENLQPILDQPLFTVDLKKDAVGHCNFGYIDSSAYIGNITYIPVNSTLGHWNWTSPSYAIGSGPFQSLSISGVVDTGATLLLLPWEVVTNYYSEIPDAMYDKEFGGYTMPCGSSPPNLWIGTSGYQVNKDGTLNTGTAISVPGNFMIRHFYDSSGVRKCFGGLQPNTGFEVALYGDIFLKAAFVVFDGGNLRLGFAAKSV